MKIFFYCASALLLVGCASSQLPAPYEDRSQVALPPAISSSTSTSSTTTSTAANGPYYIVQPNDTLGSIARQNKVTVRSLMNLNNIEDPSLINVGQRLLLRETNAAAISSSTSPSSTSTTANNQSTATSSVVVVNTPKVMKEAYSDEAYKRLVRESSGASSESASKTTETNSDSEKSKEQAKKEQAKKDQAKKEQAKKEKEKENAVPSSNSAALQWPAAGRASNFNQKSIDISGSKVDPIVAADGGVVTFAGNGLPGYGQMIIIKHSNGLISVYGNNGKIAIKEGQRVDRGQKIGEYANAPLRFEVRKKGQVVDPKEYLPKK